MRVDDWHRRVDENLYWGRGFDYDFVMKILADWELEKKEGKSDDEDYI